VVHELEVKIKLVAATARMPSYAKPGDAGLDLYAHLPAGDVIIQVDGGLTIPCGICLELPEGFEAQVRPRSGSPDLSNVRLGTIDSGYRGEIVAHLYNLCRNPLLVTHGERIAQLVIAPVIQAKLVQAKELSPSERGAAGFGSTGR
jgi:dUTP pyrophosphatase